MTSKKCSAEQPNQEAPSSIRNDPILASLLRHLPKELAASYTDEQLVGIKMILGDRVWNRHFIDRRGTFSLPFIMWRYYYVILLGKNKRAFTRREKSISALMLALTLCLGLLICTCLGFVVLYILKSALGIDLLPESSFGLWDWLTQSS